MTALVHDASYRHAPVFLLAPARSYSTVCLAMLAGHPEIFGFPELLLFSNRSVEDLLTEHRRRIGVSPNWLRNRLSGVLRAVAELHEHDQSPPAIERARRWLEERAEWTTVRLMDHLLDLVHPRIGLEKSPDTVAVPGAVDACLRAYPRARFIHLTRHPVTTQQSMHRYWAPRNAPLSPELARHAASVWHLGHLRIVRALASLPAQQWIRVRAEDLLRSPERSLPYIIRWLGLACTDEILAAMRRTERWCFAGTGPGGDLQGGDPRFMRSPELCTVAAPGPVRFDPAWCLPEPMCTRMRSLATALGY